jgi:hypothetical protein
MPYKDHAVYLRKQREFYLRRKAKRLSTLAVNTKVRVLPSTPQTRSSGLVSTKPSITQNRPSSTPGLKHHPSQPLQDKKPSMSQLLRDAMNVTSKIVASVGHSTIPHVRYKKVIDIPPDVLAKYGITRNGNVLSAGPGVDIQAVLRRLLV